MKVLGEFLRIFWAVPLLALLVSCGPEVNPGSSLDPEETFTAFCNALLACPEENAMASYGSQEGCEDTHRTNYEGRSRSCQHHVLLLEDCLSTLTCYELRDYVEVRGSLCDDERDRLHQAGCTGL